MSTWEQFDLAPYLEAKTIVLEAEPKLNARQALSEKRGA